jgi:hypothetical protein
VQEEATHLYGFEPHRNLSHWSVYASPDNDAMQSAWKVTEAILARFAADCRAESTRFVVFAVPLKLEIDDEWRAQLIRDTGADSLHIDMMRPYRRLAGFCARSGIEFYYPIDEFRTAAAKERIYFEGDSHPNVRGNILAAQCLRDILQQDDRGIGPQSAVLR